MNSLPIQAVMAQLLAALAANRNAVLIAPPGAGKTTSVAPALMQAPWCRGQILLLSPRRLAARAAAERMAQLAGEKPGQSIGYQTRMDSRVSGTTRIIVMTEGIFVNRIQADPELTGIAAVLFDEVHERSLDSDFGLALALDAQAAFRPDLRCLAMSATLDGARFGALMGGDDAPAPIIESDGTAYPLELRHIGRNAHRPIEADMAAAIHHSLADDAGDILAFLPGMAEIGRTHSALGDVGADVIVHRLHGAIAPSDQRLAIQPDAQGRRKVILATNIAETSLTIDGVRIVIDSGLARRAHFDQAMATTKLVTERASQAAARQRAGRAARQAAGIAYRLWQEAAIGGMAAFDPPEIIDSDLTSLLLQCAAWGEHDPANLRWLDPPPTIAISEARRRLRALKALDDQGVITPHGRDLAALSMPPHLAHMLLCGASAGVADKAARLAVLMQERGLGGVSEDLDMRLTHWGQDHSKRAQSADRLAHSLADRADKQVSNIGKDAPHRAGDAAALIALAYPDRIAKRRDSRGEDWQSAGGRAYRLDAASPLAAAHWLAVADIQGKAANARIISAAVLDPETIETQFADRMNVQRSVRYDVAKDRIDARIERKLGAITISSGPDAAPDLAAIADALLKAVHKHGLEIVPFGAAAAALRARAAYSGVDALADAALLADLDIWLAPLLTGKRALSAITPGALHDGLVQILGWEAMQRLNRLAPTSFQSPAGTVHDIDYAAEAGPTVTLRVQAVFGLSTHPVVGANRVPLILSLTSPAGRPIQTTRDLPQFWAGSWHDVAKEMRGKYRKHHWPDDPITADASLKTKKAQARSKP